MPRPSRTGGHLPVALAAAILLASIAFAAESKAQPVGENAQDIDARAATLRREVATARSHSFSRAWFDWERRLTRYVDGGRKDKNALKMLAAYFRGAMFDRYKALEAKGEGSLFHIFQGPASGGPEAKIKRDIHGGGGHGGWGGHGRMSIYEELVRQKVLTVREQALFKKIVIQSLSKKFIDFDVLERGASNRPFGNTGGIAAALRIFPEMPRAKELKVWVEAQWHELAEAGDIAEVNHYS